MKPKNQYPEGHKEICENCGKREWWHNPTNVHNSCKKFIPQVVSICKCGHKHYPSGECSGCNCQNI